jgi:hypothetical protein
MSVLIHPIGSTFLHLTSFLRTLFLLVIRTPLSLQCRKIVFRLTCVQNVQPMNEGTEHQPRKDSDQGRTVGQKDQPGGPRSVALGSTAAIGWELFTTVPVFGFSTPYRNAYAEMKSLQSDVAGIKTEVAGLGMEVTELRTEVTGLKTEFLASSAVVNAKLDAILEKLGLPLDAKRP